MVRGNWINVLIIELRVIVIRPNEANCNVTSSPSIELTNDLLNVNFEPVIYFSLNGYKCYTIAKTHNLKKNHCLNNGQK